MGINYSDTTAAKKELRRGLKIVKKQESPSASEGASKVILGTTGLNQRGGIIEEEFLKQLKGDNFYKAVREMIDNSPVIGAITLAISGLIKSVEYRVDANDPDSKEAVEAADFIQSCFYDLNEPTETLMADIMMGNIYYGFELREIIYKKRVKEEGVDGLSISNYDDGKIGVEALAPRHQSTVYKWLFDSAGRVEGFTQYAPPLYKQVDIPISKCLHFVTSSAKGNPQGKSALRNAYKPYYYGKTLEEYEVIGAARDLAGIPVIYLPAEAISSSPPDHYRDVYASAKSIVDNLQNGSQAGVILPHITDANGNKIISFELLRSSGGKQFNTDVLIKRYNSLIAMSLLSDFILLGHEQVGSFALSSDKTNLFAMVISGWLDEICECFNRQLIPRLCKLNGYSLELCPYFTHGDLEKQSITEFVSSLSSLFTSGLLENSDGLQDKIYDMLGVTRS